MWDFLTRKLNFKASVGQQLFTNQWEFSLADLESYAKEGY